MRDHAPHVLEPAALREQRVRHAQHALGAHGDLALAERVERLGDDAFGGVLDRDDPELRASGLDRREHVGDARDAAEHRERAEVLARRLVRERALGPEIGDADRLLERARGRDDLAEHRRDALGRERAGVPRAQALDDPALARRLVHRAALRLLRLPHLRDELGALVQLREDRVVHGIDARAQPLDLDLGATPIAQRSIRFGTRHGENALTP